MNVTNGLARIVYQLVIVELHHLLVIPLQIVDVTIVHAYQKIKLKVQRIGALVVSISLLKIQNLALIMSVRSHQPPAVMDVVFTS